MILWLGFIVSTAIIVYTGSNLSKYGDIIAEKSGIGKIWIGMVLMAVVTSLPELVTGISAVTYAQAPDIAVGDILGSCVFNILILAILDALYPATPLSSRAHYMHILAAGFGILLIGIAAIGLLLGDRIMPFGWIGVYSMIIIIVYLIAVRLVYLHERKTLKEIGTKPEDKTQGKEMSLKSALTRYSVNAVFLIAAAILLPEIGVGIAEASGLGETFVGNVLIAISTSLPEVIVSIAAIRIEAIDLAIGNIFGSNMFNIVTLGICDLFYGKGAILSFASQNNMISAILAIGMTTVAILGLTYREEKKTLFLAWDSIIIVLLYITDIMLLYMVK